MASLLKTTARWFLCSCSRIRLRLSARVAFFGLRMICIMHEMTLERLGAVSTSPLTCGLPTHFQNAASGIRCGLVCRNCENLRRRSHFASKLSVAVTSARLLMRISSLAVRWKSARCRFHSCCWCWIPQSVPARLGAVIKCMTTTGWSGHLVGRRRCWSGDDRPPNSRVGTTNSHYATSSASHHRTAAIYRRTR